MGDDRDTHDIAIETKALVEHLAKRFEDIAATVTEMKREHTEQARANAVNSYKLEQAEQKIAALEKATRKLELGYLKLTLVGIGGGVAGAGGWHGLSRLLGG